ncbi:MAG: hypothetical protein ABL973_09675 [Micropepsaceae bacterium]
MSLLVVIKTDGGPFGGRMAVGAQSAIGAVMLVIQLVARVAVFRGPLVPLICVTTLAGHAGMRAHQRKPGTLMIKADSLPGRFVVTALAGGSQPAFVTVIAGVATKASQRRPGELLIALVARRTGNPPVSSLKRIVGEAVIEIVPIKYRQLRISPLVLAVALAARRRAHKRVPSMVASSLKQLLVNRLVTISAP